MNDRERIGQRIAELRKEYNMSIRDLADYSGVNYANISKIENGKYNTGIDILSRIANVLECKIEMVENRTDLKKFIMDNKNRGDLVGDICGDLLRDKEFMILHGDFEQKNHIISVGWQHPNVQEAVILLFREFSGEKISFDE